MGCHSNSRGISAAASAALTYYTVSGLLRNGAQLEHESRRHHSLPSRLRRLRFLSGLRREEQVANQLV